MTLNSLLGSQSVWGLARGWQKLQIIKYVEFAFNIWVKADFIQYININTKIQFVYPKGNFCHSVSYFFWYTL